MNNLTDSIALVTGAGSGIGRATALELARAGCHLVLNDIRRESLESVEKEIQAMGRRTLALVADVSVQEQAEGMCQAALKHFGKVDVLVNNAGVAVNGRIEDLPLEDWRWIMNINVWAHIYTVRSLLPHMLERKSGHLVHLASAAGLLAPSMLIAYNVTKFAVVGLAETLAADLHGTGVGVTVVCPAFVNTPIFKAARYAGSAPEQATMKQIGKQVLDRGIPPEAVAAKIVKAIRKNRFLLLPHPWVRFAMWVRALFPQRAVAANSRLGQIVRSRSEQAQAK
ncbi:MAG: SDR family oxidoreductase [Nitrospirae bacterium]|nr:SDR family oxidoreductase [Nitrospirota bacterium]